MQLTCLVFCVVFFFCFVCLLSVSSIACILEVSIHDCQISYLVLSNAILKNVTKTSTNWIEQNKRLHFTKLSTTRLCEICNIELAIYLCKTQSNIQSEQNLIESKRFPNQLQDINIPALVVQLLLCSPWVL